jgi:hypothetical protein
MAYTTFFDLPTEVRNIIWVYHHKCVFKERCWELEQKMQQSKTRWHIGIHSSYSPSYFPAYDINVHIDGLNGKMYCFGSRDRYRGGELIREYRQYDKGYLEVSMDDSHGKWDIRQYAITDNIPYPGRPKDSEYYK